MKILFGVFDWGIGHATRSKPLIAALLKDGHEVHLESTGRALVVLKNYFGEKCTYHDVSSIYAPYGKSERWVLGFLLSFPRMAWTYFRARHQTARLVAEGYDKVISDCRYDLFDRPDNSYLINHQLRFSAPFGLQLLSEIFLAWRMSKYKYILVPDYAGENLSGKLSHDLHFINAKRIHYIGILSHIKKQDMPQDIDFFITLSGPEPQRSILETMVRHQAQELPGKIVLAGAKPEEICIEEHGKITCHTFLHEVDQAAFMNRATCIVSRSSYTTIMELAELEKKDCVLIPTPGQTEQEYLGAFYNEKKYFHSVRQKDLDLVRDTATALQKNFTGFTPPWKTDESVKKFMAAVFEK